MKECQNCKAENEDGNMFCDECGEEISGSNPQDLVIDATNNEPSGDEQSFEALEPAVEDGEDMVSSEPVLQTLYLPGDVEIEIREGDVEIISRLNGGHPDATIKIDDAGISSAGIKVEGRGGKVIVTDLGGGSVVVGNIIPIGEEHEVSEGGLIQTGGSYIIFG
jgi:hypothetical protein